MYIHNRERFQTTYHERDLETGLDYRYARFYDADVGRFLGWIRGMFISWEIYEWQDSR
ncbi:MAG: hypothetical protein Kow0027_06090 [Saprospiraceae bacterium]